jgi:uncharacterized protein (DUF433 family)
VTYRVSTLAGMAQTLIDSGVYDAGEVGYLLAQHADAIVRWSVPDGQGRPAIVAPSLVRAFSFIDLVSLAVVKELWGRNISEKDMRAGVAFLQQETGHEKPFAHKDVIGLLATSGASLLMSLAGGWYDIGRGGQGAFENVVRLYFKTVSYDDLGVAQLWRPAPLVVLNPKIQAGAPCLAGTRVPTAIVNEMLATDPADVVAADLNLTEDQVRAAVEFEAALAEGRGLAA